MPFTLFPPCCGRGAACPHLLLTIELGRWQWPNGDDLDLRVLQAIPAAFAGVLRNEMQHGWQQRRAAQEMYKTLLGSHYTPVHAPVAAASADEVAAAGRMGRARTAIDTDWARQLLTAGDDEGDDEGDEGDDHVEICCDKPDAESMYYSEYEYYSDDSD